jgi:3-isopropylmalate/(R)-2-methylmalate dehydratase small subunit
MQAFTVHRGIVAVIDRAHIDTDQIMPKQFLKSIHRTGFGEHLFGDWRYLADGQPDPAFILNCAPFDKATILVTRNNFGCGSSREHAVWGVTQFGFRVVIAPLRENEGEIIPAFADIFKNNSGKNGLLTIALSETEVQAFFDAVNQHPGVEATVNLEKQLITLHTTPPVEFTFQVDPGLRDVLLRGVDEIDQTLEHEQDIMGFEATHELYLEMP